MSELVLTPDVAIRDADWLDDDTLVVTDGNADVYRVRVPGESAAVAAHRLHAGVMALDALSRFTELTLDAPASGSYPLIRASPNGALVMVTHDLVVAVLAPGSTTWTGIVGWWGLYYPDITFSADGRYGLSMCDGAFVFDTSTGDLCALLGADQACWQPACSRLRVDDGRGSWEIDFSDPSRLQELARRGDLAALAEQREEPLGERSEEEPPSGLRQLRRSPRGRGLALDPLPSNPYSADAEPRRIHVF